MPTISTLTVDVNANTRRLTQGLKLAGGAILAVGAIATKMALDYDDAFTKIAAVSNASSQDIEKWKGQVLDLAGKTAQAPKELADALFFLASAGLKTSQIMPTLAASAKASAVGLGETADVAKLTANVLNAYAGSGIKAAQVTDTLVAAVREGSADTDEFGTAIGRILPIAATAGVSFGSVAASLASLSNVGLDVNEGVTAMRGLLQALISPSATAATQMEAIGLSAQDLLDSLQQNGLIATLRLLEDRVKAGSTGQAEYLSNLRAIVPNVRALTGMLGLTTQEAEKVDSIFRRVTDSTGSLDEAFKTTAESAGFQFRKALAELQVVAINLGDLILPVLAKIVDFLMHNVGPAWDSMVEGLTKAWEAVKPFAEVIGGILIPLFEVMWHTIQDRLLPVLGRLKPLFIVIGVALAVMATVILVQLALVITAVSFLIDKFLDLVGFIRDKVVEPVVNFFGRLWNFISGTLEKIGIRWDTVWHALVGVVGAVVGPIVGFIKNIVDAIMAIVDAVKTAISWLSKLGSDTQTLAPGGPRRAGGTVPSSAIGQSGGAVERTGWAFIHAGEQLIPAGAGAGLTVIINGDVTGEEIVRKVRDGLLKLSARNAGTGL